MPRTVPPQLFPKYDRELAAALRASIRLDSAIPLRSFLAHWQAYVTFDRHPSTWDAEYWTVYIHKLVAAHPATADLAPASRAWLAAHGYHQPHGTTLIPVAGDGGN